MKTSPDSCLFVDRGVRRCSLRRLPQDAVDVNASTRQTRQGILLLAHGGNPQWNDNVRALASRVDKDQPVEVAFGMATRANIQTAVDALAARGVTEIVAVPLFVSSHSSVVTSTQYLLGVRAEAPPELAAFAKMSHGSAHGAAAGATSHHGHAADPAEATRPVKSPVPSACRAHSTAIQSSPPSWPIARARSAPSPPERPSSSSLTVRSATPRISSGWTTLASSPAASARAQRTRASTG